MITCYEFCKMQSAKLSDNTPQSIEYFEPFHITFG